MMLTDILLTALLALPVLLAGVAAAPRSPRAVLRVCAAGTVLLAVCAGLLAWRVLSEGPVTAAFGFLRLDALSAYHLLIMALVFAASAVYALAYFEDAGGEGHLPLREARRYAALWFGSYSAMALVLVSDNLGMMWVGIEASTLLTAFLICIPVTRGSLEAMWKYLVMCSVGVALAFAGVLLTAAAADAAGLRGLEALRWSSLLSAAPRLDAPLMKLAFIFLVVGFGTKAGLAPMHNWLPDAHSQAPAPVSALFSGFLLNAALYAILRVLPLAEGVTGDSGWARSILVVLGLLSILIAAVFILAQRDVKRLLAYCSVEHIGVIALGAGLGGVGVFAALFHVFNHSVAKALSFFCAGQLGRQCGSHDLRRMTGALRLSPWWGAGLVAGLFALVGMAPFPLFLSELLVLKAAWQAGAWVTVALFLAGLAVIFAAMARQAIALAWEPPSADAAPRREGRFPALFVGALLALLLGAGLAMPAPFKTMLAAAAGVLGGCAP